MPTDLTGTPTSLGIGTYNVDADAPSGLGFNAAMEQIDALIAGRVETPSGIVPGEAAVWNGTGWVRSSVTGLTPSGIAGYPNNPAVFLAGDGVWRGAALPTYQTTLPASPADGQETILVDSVSAPTFAWLLRYNAAEGYWDFLGGSPAFSQVSTAETTNSTVYTGLTTTGPSITIPTAGDYVIDAGFDVSSETGTAAGVFMSYDVGSASLGAVTVTVASPAVFTLNSHGLVVNDPVFFTTTGALPTGLSPRTTYYVLAAGLTANTFEVSSTVGGSAVNTSGTQSGVHTAIKGNAALDADAVKANVGATDFTTSVMRRQMKTAIPASFTLLSKYRVSGATIGFENRWMSVRPMRVH